MNSMVSTSFRVTAKQTTRVVDIKSKRTRPLVQRVVCREETERSIATKSVNLLLGVTAAATLLTSPVDAKQVLTQPKLKSIFFEDAAAKKAEKSKTKAPSTGSAGTGGFGVDLGFLSIPLTVIGCGGLYVAGQRFGSDFEGFMESAWVKDSAANGIGYEEEYKATDYTRGGKR